MAGLQLGGKRADPKPDRRLGIKLAEAQSKDRLGGKLDAYVPPGARYDYKPPSVFARYRILTAVFVGLAVALFGYWALIARQPRVEPAQERPPPGQLPGPREVPAQSETPAQRPLPESDPVYIEPLAPR